MSDERAIIGVDIGGTKIATGIVCGTRVLERVFLPTLADRSKEEVLHQVFASVDLVLERASHRIEQIDGIGVVAPGPLDPRTGTLLYSPNIPALKDVPIVRLMRERYGRPVRIENDANAAGLAEALFGAGAGYEHVFYVTVSTGIGTGVILGGKIYGGRTGMAVEAGHVTIDYDGPLCNCGHRGCIEAFASGTAITRRTKEKLRQAMVPSLLHDLVAGDLEAITPIVVGEAARRGDPLALEVVEETARFLSIWLGGMINVFDPDIIVLGGGVSQWGDLLFSRLRQLTPMYSILPRAAEIAIVPTRLEADVGILGAAALFAST
ncbi:MAG: ROK family protein [Blastocatellia bacterium]|nr:ROK family protein [Blastocatellia bacterium]MCS7157187.1 ROK family protein [Blastocatellia bacterium]MCX7752350.1 ROK family protein [Blastocatellia bacterium]MDW8167231.1 ROK family protein [Acidobacteriota bacterium]